jgi:hypothetical protein
MCLPKICCLTVNIFPLGVTARDAKGETMSNIQSIDCETKPLRFAELHAMASSLRGVSLKLFEQLRFMTKGGQKWITISGATLADKIGYHERQVWRGLAILLDEKDRDGKAKPESERRPLIAKRTRMGFKRIIGQRGKRIWSKLANEYRLARRIRDLTPKTIGDHVAKIRPGRAFKPDTRHCAIGVTTNLILDYNRQDHGSIWDGPSSPQQALDQFMARVAATSTSRPPIHRQARGVESDRDLFRA